MFRHRFAVVLLALGLISAVRPAAAQTATFDFARLSFVNNAFYGFLPTNGVYCTGGDLCSSDVDGGVFGGNLTFVSGGLTAIATGFYTTGNTTTQTSAVQDHENFYNGLLYGPTATGAGLGAYHRFNDPSDDNITAGEKLKLSFLQVVTMNTIGLRSEGHNTTGWAPNATFEYSIDDVNWITALLPDNSGRVDLDLQGQDFYFRFGGNSADQFYLSSATATVVPEPASYLLLGAGLLGLGFAARRRRTVLG